MTWWSEQSAVPRFVLAKLAIRCRFVDRFVGSSVPSHVSGQRFSPRGALLPSAGSRRARFPVLISTMKALRLPARASPVAYLFRFRGPRDPPLFVLAFRRSRMVGGPIRARAFGQPAAQLPAHSHVDAGGISQVPRRSIPCLCPGPRPRPDRRSLTLAVSSMLPPLNPQRRLQR